MAARLRYRITHRQGRGQRHYGGPQWDVRVLPGQQYPYTTHTGISQSLSRDVRVVTLASPSMYRPAGYEAEFFPSSVVASRVNDTEIEVCGQNRNDDGVELSS